MKMRLFDDFLSRLSAQSSLFYHHLPNFSYLCSQCLCIGGSLWHQTPGRLRFPHHGLGPHVLRLKTSFTPSTSAFQVPKFCCCDLLFCPSQPCCFMAFEKQSLFYHWNRIWGGSGSMCRCQTVVFSQKLQSFLCHENWRARWGWRLRDSYWEQCQQVCSLAFP